MQYILTQEEYDRLSNQSTTELLDRYDTLYDELSNLKTEYMLLTNKYNKLLVYGVATANERLKGITNEF